MRTFPFLTIILLTAVILLIDGYAWTGLRRLLRPVKSKVLRRAVAAVYWSFTAVFILSIILISYNFRTNYTPEMHVRASYLFGLGLLSGIPKLVFIFFLLTDDLVRFLNRHAKKFFGAEPVDVPGRPMSRASFIVKTGLALSAVPFTGISYGILKGRFDFRVLTERLTFPNLPEAFDGLRIVQVSDLHIGSFDRNYDAVARGVELVNRQQGDLLFFTGDLVNNYAEEMEGWETIIGGMEAKYGKYSILGNHDYGDYSDWVSGEAKAANFDGIKGMHGATGFDLLLNGHRILSRGGQQIAVVGVENWGRPPFHKYGDLAAACAGTEDMPFRILLSHDPSHWDAEVLGVTSLDLTFSGHTHGAQFGVEVAGMKWSPVQYRYPRWAGLYREGRQCLYVNRGLGFIGFPGRVGMAPEVTVVELRRSR